MKKHNEIKNTLKKAKSKLEKKVKLHKKLQTELIELEKEMHKLKYNIRDLNMTLSYFDKTKI